MEATVHSVFATEKRSPAGIEGMTGAGSALLFEESRPKARSNEKGHQARRQQS